jgi:hypothetical protein
MRTTQTLILRLLVDPGEPQALHGVLQTVADGEEHTFCDAQSLLAVLRALLDTQRIESKEQRAVNSDQLSVANEQCLPSADC